MKTVAFGDIHGHYFEIKNLIGLVKPTDHDTLVFVGDYIDRGKQSFEVIEYMLELQQMYSCVFLTGNHEDMFMDYLSGINENFYLNNGGIETVKSYSLHGFDISGYTPYGDRAFPETHLNFIRKLKLYYEDDNYIYVHAGLCPQIKLLKNQHRSDLLWIRNEFIDSSYNFGKKVIFGHTSVKIPHVSETKIGIDTGVCYRDNLTCVILPEEKFISVPSLD